MKNTSATRDILLQQLASLGINAKTTDHPPLFTVEESRALRGEIPGAHTKNLFLKCKKGTLWLVVALEEAAIDLKRAHTRLGSGRLSFGKPELLRDVLGVPLTKLLFDLLDPAGGAIDDRLGFADPNSQFLDAEQPFKLAFGVQDKPPRAIGPMTETPENTKGARRAPLFHLSSGPGPRLGSGPTRTDCACLRCR